jgi:hypothetical protein
MVARTPANGKRSWKSTRFANIAPDRVARDMGMVGALVTDMGVSVGCRSCPKGRIHAEKCRILTLTGAETAGKQHRLRRVIDTSGRRPRFF